MSQISSIFASPPGMGTVAEEFQQAVTWGPYPRYWASGYIASTAVDSGNTPTTTLRMGLVMGIITASKQWTNYSPTATDGSQVAVGVLPVGVRMADVLTGTPAPRFWAVMVSGGVKASALVNLDNMARAQLAPRFYFDDDLPGRSDFPYLRFVTKTTSYQVLSSDNMSHFDTLGATGAVTFTLPAIANGYFFSFRNLADQNMIVASSEGANMVALNNLVANSVAFQTGSQKVGGGFNVYSNPAATRWIVQNTSAGANTVTVA